MKNPNDFFNNLHDDSVGIDGSKMTVPTQSISQFNINDKGMGIEEDSEPTSIEPETEEESSEVEKKSLEAPKEEKKEEPKEVKKQVKEEVKEEFSFEPIINQWVEQGLFSEEDIEKAEVEDSAEGLKKLISYSAEKYKEEGKKAAIEELPDYLKEMVKLHSEGVDVRELKSIEENENDFAAIRENLADDVEMQREIYLDYLTSSGMSAERAEKMVQKAEDSATLYDQAEIATEQLEKIQIKQKEDFIKSQKSAAVAAEKARVEEFEKFKNDVLSTKEIKGFSLKDKEAAQLLDYMVKPIDKSGKTQEQVAWEDPETRKLFNYLVMKKFDFSSLEKKIATKETIKLKKKIENHSDKGLSSKGTRIGIEADNNKETKIAGLEQLFGRM